MIQPSLFDWNILDTETRAFVQEKTQSIQMRLKRTAEDVIAIGLDLIAVQDSLKRANNDKNGLFLKWLGDSFDLSQRTAFNFMAWSEKFGERKIAEIAGASTILSELYNADETIIEKVETGIIPPTIPAIREAKREMQPIQSPDDLPASFGLVNGKPFTMPLPDGKPVIIPEEWKLPVEMRALETLVDPIREEKREQALERIAHLREKGVDLPRGKYSCLVVDPPWTMQKIERDVRPNQVEFDYPTMTEEELRDFPLPDFSAEDCHLYLWTTQKHLPLALRLAEHWGFRYQCLLTWIKNVGFTPFSWMYSTEHVLFCRRGNLPLMEIGRRLDFETLEQDMGFRAKVREHSRKPDQFYDLVREVSPGPRLDVFSREKREGFEQYGNEVEKYGL